MTIPSESKISEAPEYQGLSDPQDLSPLIIVEGFLSSTAPLLWGQFEDHLNASRAAQGKDGRRRVIFTSVGPVSSLHDRACELFYALKGGTVNYGLAHSSEYGHKPLGRHHSQGLYPSWSLEHPLHFLGHSMGGPTITTMLTLIRDGFFGTVEDGISDGMVCSVESVSAPFRGTGIVYDLGEERKFAPSVRQFSPGNAVTKAVHLLSYISPLIPSFLLPDLHSESRLLTFQEQSFLDFLKRLRRSDWAESRDATPWDCTFEAGESRGLEFWKGKSGVDGTEEDTGRLWKKTWFRSYAVSMTQRIDASKSHHAPKWVQLLDAGPLFFSSSSLGTFDYTSIFPPPKFTDLSATSSSSHRLSKPTLPKLRINTELKTRTMPATYPVSSVPPSPRVINNSPLNDGGSDGFTPSDWTLSSLASTSSSLDSPIPIPPPLQNIASNLKGKGRDLLHPFRNHSSSQLASPMIPPIVSPIPINAPIQIPGSTPDREKPLPASPVASIVIEPPLDGLSLDLHDLPEEYFANDGVVPLFSQWHPGHCVPGVRCVHYAEDAGSMGAETAKSKSYEPGVFHVVDISTLLSPPSRKDKGKNTDTPVQKEPYHHLSIMPLWVGTNRQRAFWRDLGEWLETVDEAWKNI